MIRCRGGVEHIVWCVVVRQSETWNIIAGGFVAYVSVKCMVIVPLH